MSTDPKTIAAIASEILQSEEKVAFDWFNEDHIDYLMEIMVMRYRDRTAAARTALDAARLTAKSAEKRLQREHKRWILPPIDNVDFTHELEDRS